MKTTLSDLHQHTAKVLRPVIHAGKTVDITDRGRTKARIIPARPKADRRAAWKALMEIGPVPIKPRK